MNIYSLMLLLLTSCSHQISSVTFATAHDPMSSALQYTLSQALSVPLGSSLHIDALHSYPPAAMNDITRLNYKLVREHYAVTAHLKTAVSSCSQTWHIYPIIIEPSNTLLYARRMRNHDMSSMIYAIQSWSNKACQ